MTLAPGTTSFSLPHTYDYGGVITVLINNVAPTLSAVTATATDEGSRTTLSGTISDPSALDSFTLDVDWSDLVRRIRQRILHGRGFGSN